MGAVPHQPGAAGTALTARCLVERARYHLRSAHAHRIATTTGEIQTYTFEPERTDQDMPSLGGRLIIVRTTKDAALKVPTTVPDLFDVQSIRLDRDIPGVHEKASVVYRIRTDTDPEPETAIPQDARQKIENLDPKTNAFDLTVTAVREPRAAANGKAPGEEYTGTSFFVENLISAFRSGWMHTVR